MSGERFLRGKTRRAVRRSLAELSERPLRARRPVLRWWPFALHHLSRCSAGRDVCTEVFDLRGRSAGLGGLCVPSKLHLPRRLAKGRDR
jgi:hypothetical protein